MTLVSITSVLALGCQTIAAQNERSGFITLIGYISLIYSFLGDLIIFDILPRRLEIIGIVLIFGMNLTVVCKKWEPVQPAQISKV